VSFADASHGIAVGGGNLIYRTTDGGAHWTSAPDPYITAGCYGVSYVDATHAWRSAWARSWRARTAARPGR